MKNVLLHIRFAVVVVVVLLTAGCTEAQHSSDDVLVVSIEPLRYIVGNIVGDDFRIEVLVPSGSSPETYSPTPRQMVDAESSHLIFATGLMDFENRLVERISKNGQSDKVVNLSRGISLLTDACGHHHSSDPHLWTSPRRLSMMAENAYNAISSRYPDSVKYFVAYTRLQHEISSLDSLVRQSVTAKGDVAFVVYHPSYGYFAADYGAQQIAIEQEGKEPSAERMRQIIDKARAAQVHKVLYQREFPQSTVQAVASELGADAVAVDILGADVYGNTVQFINIISSR